MAALLAMISAGAFGAADFLGGLSARRIRATLTTAIAQSTGLFVLLFCSAFAGGSPSTKDLLWGVGSGLGSGVGILLFYWALTVGSMSIVAPLSAAVAAVAPVVVGIALGERPGAAAVVGVCVALPAVALIGSGQAGGGDPAGPRPSAASARWLLPGIVAAGLCFGWVLISLSRTSDQSGLWPLTAGRLTSASLLVGLAALTRSRWPGGPVRSYGTRLAMSAGTLDSLAFAGLLVATRSGLLSLIGVISALYPASTILLARVVLNERLLRHQVVGLCLAAVAVCLIALG